MRLCIWLYRWDYIKRRNRREFNKNFTSSHPYTYTIHDILQTNFEQNVVNIFFNACSDLRDHIYLNLLKHPSIDGINVQVNP